MLFIKKIPMAMHGCDTFMHLSQNGPLAVYVFNLLFVNFFFLANKHLFISETIFCSLN